MSTHYIISVTCQYPSTEFESHWGMKDIATVNPLF